jgi:hypothetical protein
MREIPLGLAAPDHTVPYGTVLSGALFQALRARLRSHRPSGTAGVVSVIRIPPFIVGPWFSVGDEG